MSDSKSDASWICIGDINRQESQGRRGGGTTCFQNRAIARLYQSSIETFECCDGRNGNLLLNISCENPAFLFDNNISRRQTRASFLVFICKKRVYRAYVYKIFNKYELTICILQINMIGFYALKQKTGQ